MTHCELIEILLRQTKDELHEELSIVNRPSKSISYLKGKINAYEELLQILKGNAAVPAMKRD